MTSTYRGRAAATSEEASASLVDGDLESIACGAWFLAGVLVTVGVAIAAAAAGGGITVAVSKALGHTKF